MKQLTAEEIALFAEIDEPVKLGNKRLTRPVVVTYYFGKVIGIDSIPAWRRFRANGKTDNYIYELRNMWI